MEILTCGLDLLVHFPFRQENRQGRNRKRSSTRKQSPSRDPSRGMELIILSINPEFKSQRSTCKGLPCTISYKTSHLYNEMTHLSPSIFIVKDFQRWISSSTEGLGSAHWDRKAQFGSMIMRPGLAVPWGASLQSEYSPLWRHRINTLYSCSYLSIYNISSVETFECR